MITPTVKTLSCPDMKCYFSETSYPLFVKVSDVRTYLTMRSLYETIDVYATFCCAGMAATECRNPLQHKAGDWFQQHLPFMVCAKSSSKYVFVVVVVVAVAVGGEEGAGGSRDAAPVCSASSAKQPYSYNMDRCLIRLHKEQDLNH